MSPSGTASTEENVLEAEIRVKVAQHAAAVELAENQDQFLNALVEELSSWDVYLERLQVNVATSAGEDRDQAEAAIRELRHCRNGLGARLAEMSSTSGEQWREVRANTRAAREEFESRAAAVEAMLAGRAER